MKIYLGSLHVWNIRRRIGGRKLVGISAEKLSGVFPPIQVHGVYRLWWGFHRDHQGTTFTAFGISVTIWRDGWKLKWHKYPTEAYVDHGQLAGRTLNTY